MAADRYLLRYPGGDYYHAKYIYQLLAQIKPFECDTYIEPFFGEGGSVLFHVATNRLCRRALINDIDPLVVNFLECVFDPKCRDIMLYELGKWRPVKEKYPEVRNEYLNIKDRVKWPRHDPYLAAVEAFMRQFSVMGLIRGDVPRMSNRISDTTLENMIKRIRKYTDTILRNITIVVEWDDGLNVIHNHAADNDLVYADPPHHNALRLTRSWDAEYLWGWSSLSFMHLLHYCNQTNCVVKYTYSEDIIEAAKMYNYYIVEYEYRSAMANHAKYRSNQKKYVFLLYKLLYSDGDHKI